VPRLHRAEPGRSARRSLGDRRRPEAHRRARPADRKSDRGANSASASRTDYTTECGGTRRTVALHVGPQPTRPTGRAPPTLPSP
jgi:hypothetical protein